MSESHEPVRRPDAVFGFDDIQGFDVEAIPCQDAINPIQVRGVAQIESGDSLTEFTDDQVLPGEDPGRPAA